MKRLTGLALVACTCTLAFGCVGEGTLKQDMGHVPLTGMGDGWGLSDPATEGINGDAVAAAYERFYSEDEFPGALAMLVVRNGQLVAEGYTRGATEANRIMHLQSVTKVFTSTMLGVAADEGYLSDLDATLRSVMPDAFGNAGQADTITIRHLLTMRSGIDIDNGRFALWLHSDQPADPVGDLLQMPFYNYPGAEFYYRDADPHLVSALLQRLTGQRLDQLYQQKIFAPLGITQWRWEIDPANIATGAYGLWLTARDTAKFGKLILQGGDWEGQQLVSSSWITEATSFQSDTDPENEYIRDYDFGYYWWLIPELNAFSAWGHGGQFVTIVPSANLVMVMRSLPDSNEPVAGTLGQFQELVQIVLDGIE